MTTTVHPPVLVLGGTGSLSARTVRTLRRLHPELPLTIAARDLSRADALAAEIGNATTTTVDLDRADLGLVGQVSYSAVVTAVRDHSLNTLRYAQSQQIPYVALSDGIFEIGPTVARHIHTPTIPVLLLGHSDGGVPLVAALHFAAEFRTVDTIEIGLLFDPEDPFGPASAVDLEHIGRVGPRPLIVRDGRWHWAGPELAARRFTDVDGVEHEGSAAGLLDVLGLGAGSTARSVRIDLAEGQTASSRRGEGPSHEAIIEIEGEHRSGQRSRRRYEIVDPDGYAALSARGVALAVERLLGLDGNPVPTPGLYLLERLIDPVHLMKRLADFGVTVTTK
ncbi:saccharopine dehydrogenase [Nocardia wallacei]|uniref:saccharopine dehydrogenase n=1 Tax=Nocardia wallacei TaxID=480035 RepID=UPI0024540EB3|nr:saccharopine dehydrogenase [Nocardia wallacei]